MKKARNKNCIIRALFTGLFFLSFAFAADAQTRIEKRDAVLHRSTAAYAEITLKRTELESELEGLLVDYTEEYPRVQELKQSIVFVDAERSIVTSLKAEQLGVLTVAAGKLMVRRAELRTDLWKLLLSYKEEHPDVKRVKRRIQIYDKAIAELIGQ